MAQLGKRTTRIAAYVFCALFVGFLPAPAFANGTVTADGGDPPGQHPYLVGDSEGRAVVDSVRAARYLNGSLSNLWVVAGHSQGGQAALFAGEIADTYGMGLQLKGVVAVAPVANLDLIAPALVG